MKNKIKYLAIIVFTLSVFNGCIEPIGTMPDLKCNLGAHLGIGEKCATTGDTSCGLKNYNTSTGADTFPVPIYRVGAESNSQTLPLHLLPLPHISCQYTLAWM